MSTEVEGQREGVLVGGGVDVCVYELFRGKTEKRPLQKSRIGFPLKTSFLFVTEEKSGDDAL